MKLEITKEDITELLETRILEKSFGAERISRLKQFPININESTYGKKLRYQLYLEINAIFVSAGLASKYELIFINGFIFNTIINYQIEYHMDNKSYYDIQELSNDMFECLEDISREVNYITLWDE